MRVRKQAGGLAVHAIAGTNVVMLAMDMTPALRKGCLGFAIRRTDHDEGEALWMRGIKVFGVTDPAVGPGNLVSLHDHPWQSFQWADYSVKPGRKYTYRVVPMFGTPRALTEKPGVELAVQTEPELGKKHSVFFNRGAAASQEYTRRFGRFQGDKLVIPRPGEIEPKLPPGTNAAYRWLSRGLLEACCNFIARAKDNSFSLHAAIYEFQWPTVLDACKSAKQRGVKVSVIYDGIGSGTGPKPKNEQAIAKAGLGASCKPRTHGTIMHNKFIVLSKNGVPIAVWTGSTNITENGIFGHSNFGHIVEDKAAAGAFFAYWKQLDADATTGEDKQWAAAENPVPEQPWSGPLSPVFSPHAGQKVLEHYAAIAAAKKPLFMTFAFGMNPLFQSVYRRKDGVLRFALMESKAVKKDDTTIDDIRTLPNVVCAVGNSIRVNAFDRWIRELNQATATAHVRYIHTKYLLLDPLGAEPVVVAGSANFSKASTDSNNENMLVIRGDRRVADIYLGEFMRLHTHYAFRESLTFTRNAGEWKPQYLTPDASWQQDFFKPGHQRCLRREYFVG